MSSRKKPLTCQSTHVDIVIRKNKKLPINRIKEYCQTYFKRWAFIEHEGDIKPSTGEVEGVHYHICGDLLDKKVPFSTRLNQIKDFFRFKDVNGIEIDQYRSFEGALQYLTHKNQPDKTQHKKTDIYHNLTKEDFEIFYNADIGGDVITYELLYRAIINASNIIEVIKVIGIGNYRTWRAVVWDVWNCLNGSPDTFRNKERFN